MSPHNSLTDLPSTVYGVGAAGHFRHRGCESGLCNCGMHPATLGCTLLQCAVSFARGPERPSARAVTRTSLELLARKADRKRRVIGAFQPLCSATLGYGTKRNRAENEEARPGGGPQLVAKQRSPLRWRASARGQTKKPAPVEGFSSWPNEEARSGGGLRLVASGPLHLWTSGHVSGDPPGSPGTRPGG